MLLNGMKQEDKDLLLKDLCARLPYNPLVEYKGESYNALGIAHGRLVLCKPFMSYTLNEHPLVEEVKPYLFPLSSMTEEQKIECFKGTPLEIDKYGDIAVKDDFYGGSQYTDLEIYLEVIDWINKNHFDYRGLIEKGLAIDCTNLNIY